VAEPPGVQRRVNHRPGHRRSSAVPLQQDRDAGQELGNLPIPGLLGGRQPGISAAAASAAATAW
jgi:hypothetical protein